MKFKSGEQVYVPHLSSNPLVVYYKSDEDGFYVLDVKNPKEIHGWYPMDGEVSLSHDLYKVPLVFKVSKYAELNALGFYVVAPSTVQYKQSNVKVPNDDRTGYFDPKFYIVPTLYRELPCGYIKCINLETFNVFITDKESLTDM